MDVVVVGGGVAGLLAAREVSRRGCSVKVFEEDLEIGFPEHCDGMVSANALSQLGVIPSRRSLQNEIRRALLHSPNGYTLELDAGRQKTIVLDRSVFDQELAAAASKLGAEIEVGKRVTALRTQGDNVQLHVDRSAAVTASYAIDARGCPATAGEWRGKLLQAAKYEVSGRWFQHDTVELFFDQRVSPGFFTWVIPVSDDVAKVGVAGTTINPFKTLDSFLKNRKSSVLKKIAAPIMVGGPARSLVSGRVVKVGDAAGQAKPTTGGGIYTGGMGGCLAGNIVTQSVMAGDGGHIERYDEEWRRRFEREFNSMLRVRRLLGALNNRRLEGLFKAVGSSGLMETISLEGDFDFHSNVVLHALKLEGVLKILGEVALGELRSLFSGRA